MGDTPKNQKGAKRAKKEADANSVSVIGPPSATSTNAPPTHPQNGDTKQKCRWTQDPGMFVLTLLGLIALIVYTGYTRLLVIDAETNSAAQATLTREVMMIDHRAWIGPPKITPDVSADQETVDFKYVWSNSGKTPTTSLYIGAEITTGPNLLKTTDRICSSGTKAVAKGNFISIAPTIDFPATENPPLVNTKMRISDLRIEHQFIAGCAAYGIFGDPVPHRSGFYSIISLTKDGKVSVGPVYAISPN